MTSLAPRSSMARVSSLHQTTHCTFPSFLCLTVTTWYGSRPLIKVLYRGSSASQQQAHLTQLPPVHITQSIKWCQLAAALESSRALLQSVPFRNLRPNPSTPRRRMISRLLCRRKSGASAPTSRGRWSELGSPLSSISSSVSSSSVWRGTLTERPSSR
jgi:type II secretory pathway component PulJ